MTYVRVTRDPRGYETTLLLHSTRPGAPPRVLYWYRTAPGVRVGRTALDEDAIRSIEEQHPDIDFDWPQLLEEAREVPPDVERRPERRRKSVRTRDGEDDEVPVVSTESSSPPPELEAPAASEDRELPPPDELIQRREPAVEPSARNPLLEQLVGREIATRLRTRFREISARIAEVPSDDERRARWQARAEALDPDRWSSPDQILHGIEHADARFDELRHEVLGTQ